MLLTLVPVVVGEIKRGQHNSYDYIGGVNNI